MPYLGFSNLENMGWFDPSQTRSEAIEVMEISAVDPNLGANFYTLSQIESARPKFRRHTHECLQCHGSS